MSLLLSAALALLLPVSAHAARAVMEGIPSSRAAISVSTNPARVHFSTTAYGDGVPNVGVYITSNVVIGDDNACVLYSSGSIACKSAELAHGVLASTLTATVFSSAPLVNTSTVSASDALALYTKGGTLAIRCSGDKCGVGPGAASLSSDFEVTASVDPTLKIEDTSTSVSAGDAMGSIDFADSDSSTGGGTVKASIDATAREGWSSNNPMEMELSHNFSRQGGTRYSRQVFNSTGSYFSSYAAANTNTSCTTCTVQVQGSLSVTDTAQVGTLKFNDGTSMTTASGGSVEGHVIASGTVSGSSVTDRANMTQRGALLFDTAGFDLVDSPAQDATLVRVYGMWVEIASGSLSSVTSYTFDNSLIVSSGVYKVWWNVTQESVNGHISIRINGDSGTNYVWSQKNSCVNTDETQTNSTADAQFRMSGSNPNQIGQTSEGEATVTSQRASYVIGFRSEHNQKLTTTNLCDVRGSGQWNGTASLSSIAIHAGAGTMSGIVRLYRRWDRGSL